MSSRATVNATCYTVEKPYIFKPLLGQNIIKNPSAGCLPFIDFGKKN